jgi:AAA+ superfamily predicted ATPase
MDHHPVTETESTAAIAAQQTERAGTEMLLREPRLVLARVRARARLRAEWLRRLWDAEGPPGAGLVVSHAEVDAVLEDRDSPEAEAAWLASEARLAPYRSHLAAVEKELAQLEASRLAGLANVFGLSRQDMDLLQACLATALDPSLRRVWAYLQDHAGRAYMTADLAARLFGYGPAPWNAESGLFRWELITETEVGPGEPRLLACDPYLVDWFTGRQALDHVLLDTAQLHPPLPPLARWPVAPTVSFLERVLNDHSEARVRVTIYGPRKSGRRTLAAAVASRLGLPLLVIDADAIGDQEWRRVFLHAQRQAYLNRYALAWHGETLLRRPWPRGVPPFPVQFLILEPGESAPPAPGLLEHAVEVPALTVDDRRRLWRQHLRAAKSWRANDLTELAARYRATAGEIAAVGAKELRTTREAAEDVRKQGRGRLDGLAQPLECPFDWDDLVVSDYVREALEDLAFEAEARVAFWEQPQAQRLFPQGRGLLALFSGSPGTGKTMAAQVIAARLGFDLYRINLSMVISKYVGETSQNIERVLRSAALMDVVLFFDEADALYAKRTTEIRDAQDRFANMDTSHLMVAIENYRGIALLATNLKSNIDPAFLRRLRYVVDFPKPDAAQRLAIWRKVVVGLAGDQRLAALAQDLEMLAAAVEATGAQIKNSVLAASFMAQRERRPLGLPHLVRGLNRELSKEGHALSDRERERLLGHAR